MEGERENEIFKLGFQGENAREIELRQFGFN
jgi:hypothetical protein